MLTFLLSSVILVVVKSPYLLMSPKMNSLIHIFPLNSVAYLTAYLIPTLGSLRWTSNLLYLNLILLFPILPVALSKIWSSLEIHSLIKWQQHSVSCWSQSLWRLPCFSLVLPSTSSCVLATFKYFKNQTSSQPCHY